MTINTKPQALLPAEHAIERLEAEITELWGHINAAEYRCLKRLADFDRHEGYARHGLPGTSHRLN